ncbi:hypothetical protein HG15A2_38490 [Adhaeretor mobilis]|uniref:Uncharacterized protein n=1 Tax=Adhaeretor mobilis TaxID=1930276 RepID=A0A517N055_9BACT|nr:hypothetical protein HG15A2_38490 [Adhaeretor mobilis]
MVVGVYFYTHMDDEIRRKVEVVLAEKFPQLQVNVGGARLIEGQGIAIYDLHLEEAASGKRENHLLSVDELLLECNASLPQLLQGIPDVRRVVVRRPRCWLRRDPSGRLNVEAFFPLTATTVKRPPIVIEGASIAFSDLAKPNLKPLTVRDINLTIAGANAGASTPQAVVKVNGTLSGTQLRQARLRAWINPVDGNYRAELGVDEFQFDEDLLAWLVAHAPQNARDMNLGCQASGVIEVSGNAQAVGQVRVAADLQVVSGHAEHPRLPRPLTNLQCRVKLAEGQIEVSDFHAQCGPAAIAASARRNGFAPSAPTSIAARVVQLPLDKSLRNVLPLLLQEQWEKHQPTGLVDATLQATFDGQHWSPTATLTGSELAFESDKFPYRLTDGSGTILVTPRQGDRPMRLDIDMTGQGGGQPIHIVGQIFDPKPAARGWVKITGENVEIEKRMIAALPPKSREVITSLHPAGKMNFLWRIDRQQDGQLPRTSLQLNLVDLSVKYDKFPYPLSGISGTVQAEDDRWTFRDIVSNGRRQIRCQGYLQPVAVGSALSLRFTGEQVPLDDNLYEAFDEDVQNAWTELRPRGHVDFMADVDYRTGQGKPRIRAEIRPRAETASLRPRFFDYLMEDVSGVITYDEGAITLNDVRARHARTKVLTNGNGFFSPNGQWQMQLVGLTVDKVAVGRTLLTALPAKLSKLIDSLHPTGSFRIDNGVLSFEKSASAMAPIKTDWDFQLTCQQTDLQCGIDLHNLHGTVRLMGASDEQRNYSAGELDLDSVMFEGVQFTNVKGPIWVDDSQCLFGRRAASQNGQPPRPVTASAYDGRIAADAMVTFYGLPRYEAEANLVGVDLKRLTVERFGSTEEMKGKVDANVKIGGQGRSQHQLTGSGDVRIRDAEIYESPVLLRVLKTLRSGKTDKSAFNEGHIRFRLDGRHVTLQQLDFYGDVVNLKGKGYTNFDQDLKLVFHAEVGRTDYQLPFVKNLVKTTNQQILQLYVDGTMSNPIVQKQAFPGINQLLDQIQSDFEAPPPQRTQQAQRPQSPRLPSTR